MQKSLENLSQISHMIDEYLANDDDVIDIYQAT